MKSKSMNTKAERVLWEIVFSLFFFYPDDPPSRHLQRYMWLCAQCLDLSWMISAFCFVILVSPSFKVWSSRKTFLAVYLVLTGSYDPAMDPASVPYEALFWDRVSCILHWPEIFTLTKDNLEFLILLHPPLACQITGMCQIAGMCHRVWFLWCRGPRV